MVDGVRIALLYISCSCLWWRLSNGLDTSILSLLDTQEISSERYGLTISKIPVLFDDKRQHVVHVANKFGQLYQCDLPHTEKVADASAENTQAKDKNVSVTDILDKSLNGRCITYAKDWWTYKLCYKSSIVQYHDDGSGKVPANGVVLGLYESEKNWSSVPMYPNVTSLPVDFAFHSQKYVNGTLCDLTKQPRETIVKFRCDEDSVDSIKTVEEPSTCSYIITVHTSSLCAHPLLSIKTKPKTKTIMCSPALGQHQFSIYKEKESEKVTQDSHTSSESAKQGVRVSEKEINDGGDQPMPERAANGEEEPETDQFFGDDKKETVHEKGKADSKMRIFKVDLTEPELTQEQDTSATGMAEEKSKISQTLSKLQQRLKNIEEENKELTAQELEVKGRLKLKITMALNKLRKDVKELHKLLIKIARKKKRKTNTQRQKDVLERLLKKTQETVKKIRNRIRNLEIQLEEIEKQSVPQMPSGPQLTTFTDEDSVSGIFHSQEEDIRGEGSKVVATKDTLAQKNSLVDVLAKISATFKKLETVAQDASKEADVPASKEKNAIATDKEAQLDTEVKDDKAGEETSTNLDEASKEMEQLVKEELASLGLNVGGSLKVKIITDPVEMKKYKNAKTAEHTGSPDMADFKDLLFGLLGGKSSQRMEEDRANQLETSYNYVWDEENVSRDGASQDNDDKKILL